MFWIIPLILIGGSLYGIGYIVWPKFNEIKAKKELPEIKESFRQLMFPEIFRVLGRVKKFRDNLLVEYEKFLRRVKILSLRTDNLANKLLEKRQKTAPKAEFKEPENQVQQKANNTYFKTKENNLIAEITKNPKDKNLYRALGAFYLDNKMYGDAKEVFNVVLELDPSDLETKESLEKIGKMG